MIINLTFQERNGAILSVWYFCNQPFIPVGNVELEKLVHATVLLISGQQTHCKGVNFGRRKIFFGIFKGSACVCPSIK